MLKKAGTVRVKANSASGAGAGSEGTFTRSTLVLQTGMSKPQNMPNSVKWGILFALEADVANYLENLKKWQPDMGDMKNLVAACDWHLEQSPPKYVNMSQFRQSVEKLREQCKPSSEPTKSEQSPSSAPSA